MFARVWSLPVTKEKALKLWHLLEHKLEAEAAQDHLFSLLGHQELFDKIADAKADQDVRPYVLDCLKAMLRESPPCFEKAWQTEARQICKAAIYQRQSMVI